MSNKRKSSENEPQAWIDAEIQLKRYLETEYDRTIPTSSTSSSEAETPTTGHGLSALLRWRGSLPS
jgi:hypothetical protein